MKPARRRQRPERSGGEVGLARDGATSGRPDRRVGLVERRRVLAFRIFCATASTVSRPWTAPFRSTTIPVWTSASSIIERASLSVVRRFTVGETGFAIASTSSPYSGMSRWAIQPSGRSASSIRRT